MNGRRFGVVLMVAGVGLLGAPAAEGYRLGGQAWTKRTVTYRVAVAKYREPMAQAARQWNASGVRFGFREVRSGRADIVVRSLPVPAGTPCLGTVGRATTGNTFGFQGFLELHPACTKTRLIPIATHELGHVLGLAHSERRCALMTPAGGTGCTEERRALPWEVVCRGLRPDDLAGAIKRYGGRAKALPKNRICFEKPTPGPVSAVAIETNPPGSLGAARITWTNPTSKALRRVVVNREEGRCPNYPAARGLFTYPRPGSPPVGGDPVANVAATGAGQSAVDLGDVPAGRFCWSVWALGPGETYLRAASKTIDTPGTSHAPGRIGFTASRMLGAEARLTWQNPSDPGVSEVWVRRTEDACPEDPDRFSGGLVERLPVSPGAVTLDVPGSPTFQPVCYGLQFRAETPFRVLTPILVQLG